MEVLKPLVENILYNIVIPVMFVTEKDMNLFQNDPIEYIRNLYDFCDTMHDPKNQMQDLLTYLCKYKSTKKKNVKPDYLQGFLQYAVSNLNEYD